jgi:acetyltransferase-like isoleucine patch superfamily enzyme
MIIEYFVEQINVSDDEYTLLEMSYESGSFVGKNKIIFCYESSKSIHEVSADGDGYLYFNPRCRLEENFNVGFKLALQSPGIISEDDLIAYFDQESNVQSSGNENVRISKKAKELIDKHNLTVSEFGEHEIISEKVVGDYLDTFSPKINNLSTYTDKNSETTFFVVSKVRLAVVGAGKAVLQLWDALLDSDKYEVVKFYDSDTTKSQQSLFGIEILRGDVVEDVTRDFANDDFDECIISFSGDIKARKSIFLALKDNGISFANIIHSTACVSQLSNLGQGNIIFSNTRIGPFCSIGDNNFLSAACSIEHNNIIGSHNTFGPGVLFSGSVCVGDENKFGTMIGMEPNVVIGSGNIIASSQVVTISLSDKKIMRSRVVAEVKDLKD